MKGSFDKSAGVKNESGFKDVYERPTRTSAMRASLSRERRNLATGYPGYRGQLKTTLADYVHIEQQQHSPTERTSQQARNRGLSHTTMAMAANAVALSKERPPGDFKGLAATNMHDVDAKISGEDKQNNLRKTFLQQSPFYLNKHEHVRTRQPDPQMCKTAGELARQRFQQTLSTK